MPKLVLTNPGVRDSVTRPVVLDVVRQILAWTGLPKDTQILFPGYDEKALQPGSTISSEKEFNFFDTHSMWKISIEETHQEDRALSMAVLYDDNPRIFDDEDARVWIRPAYSPCDITLRIRSRFTDKDSAIRWREDIRTRVGMNREARVHTVSYSYLLPPAYIRILEEIHRMREAVAPYNQTWQEYLAFYFSPKARQLSDMVGKNQQWGVAETQARVLGYFNFEYITDENEKDGETSAQNIEFTYTFKYDKPSASVMSYPLVINNQLMDKAYRQTAKDERVEDHVLQYSQSAYSLAHFENSRPTENFAMPGISIPEFDEFIPVRGSIPPDTIRVFTGLTTIDEASPLDLLDLNQLGTVKLDPSVLNFLKTEVQWLTRVGMSIFNVMVFRNEYPISKDDFEVTSDLVVRLKKPANLRDVYHVRLAMFQNPEALPTAAKDRIRNDCTTAKKLFEALMPSATSAVFAKQCMVGNYMSRKDFDELAGEVDRYFSSKRIQQLYHFNTVMSLFVQTSHGQANSAVINN